MLERIQPNNLSFTQIILFFFIYLELMASPRNDRHGKSPVTCYLVLAAIVCFAGSSLQFGFNLTVINAPQEVRV